MTNNINILVALAVFGGAFHIATLNSRPAAAMLVSDAFHQLPVHPLHGSVCLPMSRNIEDRRDPIAVLIGNN